jgi:hypothetical protein
VAVVGHDRFAGARCGQAPAVPGEKRFAGANALGRSRIARFRRSELNEALVVGRFHDRSAGGLEESVFAGALGERTPGSSLFIKDIDPIASHQVFGKELVGGRWRRPGRGNRRWHWRQILRGQEVVERAGAKKLCV